MKRKYQITLIFAFILVFLISFASTWRDSGELIQEVDGCNILNTTGATYTLTQNVSSTETCFEVIADNIVLDCNGYWINYDGTGSQNAYGLYTNKFNTTLKNCNIYNYTIGAYYHGASNGTIQNNTIQTYQNRTLLIDDIYDAGLDPIASGILLYDSADYNLIINTISYSQYGRGIYLNEATNNTIVNSNGSSYFNPGIQIYTNDWDESAGYNNTVLNSYAFSNSDIGLLIGYYGGWNEVINSTILSNSSQGDGHALAIEYSEHNRIINTTGHASYGDGIMILAGENTLILNSTGKSDSGSAGISLYYGTIDSVIANSTGTSELIYGGCGIIIGEGTYSPSSNNILIDSIGISVGEEGSGICIGGFNNTIMRSTAIGERAYYFDWNATDILVADCVNTTGSSYGVYAHRDWDVDITFLNCSYGYESIRSAGSNLTRKWYYQAYVNDTFGNPLPNVNVTAYNSTGHLQFTQSTTPSGSIDRFEVIDYINRGGRRTSYNDYTLGAYLEGHPPAKNHIINFGNINNKVDDWFTIREPDFTSPLITIISPIGTVADVTPLINVSLSEEARVWYSVDDGENITLCEECDFSYDKFLYVNEGEHILRVFANDSSGNFNLTSTSFTVDMNNNYYEDFEDNSSILLSNDILWNKGNVSFKKGFNYLEDPGLVSAYLFNDSDNLGFDLKGNNNMDEVIGSPSRSSIVPLGKTGHSIYLDGNSEICISSGFTFDPSEDNTICFWVMKEDGGNIFAQTCIYDTWGDYPDYTFTANNCGSLKDEVTVEGVFEIDKWVHICQTYDSANDNFSIYVDGTENISKILNSPIEYSLDLEWCIGGFYGAGFMVGNVFEPMWFNRQLSPDEINFIYSEGNYYSSGNFTSYPVNTTEDIFRITNVSWTEVNTGEDNNITIQVSADGGENWYNPTSGEGLEQNFAEGNNSLVYRVMFSTIDSSEPIAITSMNISWDNKIEISGENICGVLDEEGKTYVLTENVSSTGTCFEITADNITLDCNGHWINFSTSGDDETYGVYSDRSYSTIKNCNIIDGNPLSENRERKGILLDESHFVNILYNNITTTMMAINLRGANNTLLVGNFLNVTYINESAIHMHSSCKNTLINNTLYGGDYVLALEGQGVYLNTQDNLLINNRVFARLSSGAATLVQYASNNTFINESYYTPEGINVWLVISNNNLFRDCTFTGEDSDPIDTGWDSDSINNTFVNCTYNEGEVNLPVNEGPDNWFLTKWYYQTYVNDTNGNSLSNVNITAHNSLGLLEFTALTDENGRIVLQDVTNSNITSKSGTTYFSNYTISAAAEGYYDSNKQLNITLTKNKLNDFFTLESTGDVFPPNIIFQEPPTPENTSIVSTSNVTIVANVSDSSITSSWIDLDRSLVGYWGMDSFNASGVYDGSSYNNFGTFEGGLSPLNSVESVRGRGIKFDGVDDYISVNDIQNMGQKFTISLWSNVFGNSSGEDYWGGMFTEYNEWGTDDGYGLLIGQYFSPFSEGSGMITTARIGNYSDIWREDSVVIDEGYTLNTWRHYVVVWDYPYLSVYLNGEAVDSIIFNYKLNPTWSNIKFGMMLFPDWFNGSLDEVMVFNRTLSEIEIKALYDSQSNLVNATFDNLELGQHNYTIYAVDEYGNIANSELRNFILNEDELVPGENTCGVLNEPNRVYTLTKNVSSTGTCFEIGAENITLDCNGYWMNYFGDGLQNSYGIYSDRFNTTIKNCNIYNYTIGISFNGSSNGRIENNNITLYNNKTLPIYDDTKLFEEPIFPTSPGILLYNSSNYNLIVNTTSYSYYGRGIYINEADNNTVVNSNGSSHFNPGIHIYSSLNNSIINSYGLSELNIGILVGWYSEFTELINSTAKSTNESAIASQYSEKNKIINSLGYASEEGTGIEIFAGVLGSEIINSTGFSNGGDGIRLTYGSHNNLIANSTGITYGGWETFGIYISESSFSPSENNTLIDSKGISNLTASKTAGITLGGTNNIAIRNNATGNYAYFIKKDSTTFVVSDCTYTFGLEGDIYYDSNVINSTITFINCSYDDSKEIIQGIDNNLIRKWYYQAYVNDTLGNLLDNARVVAYNSIGDLEFTGYTDNTGWIPLQEITEYVNDGGTRNYYSDYTLAATFEGYNYEMILFNLANETKNKMDYFFTLEKGIPGENICGVLDEEGKTYVLTENVSSTGTCFEITADNITLDCNGHWIDYSKLEYYEYGINVSECKGTRIKNCNIVGGATKFSHGILLDNSNNSEIFNNSIITKGVVSDSISLYTSNFTNIYNNTLYNYEDRGHSIYSRSSAHNTVSNLIIYTHHNGIYLEYGSHNWSIFDLSVFVNNSSGIVLDVDSDNIFLNNLNVTSNNGAIGLLVNSSLNNISNANVFSDLNSSLILNGIGNNIVNSTFHSNSEYSVYLVGGENNSLINNTFLGAKEDGSLLRILESSGNNLFYWNNFTETEGYFINNGNDSNYFNTTISGTSQGNYYFGISSKIIYDSNNNGWGDKGSEYPLNADNWEEKWIGYGVDYGPSTSRKEDLVSPTFAEVSHTDNVAGENCWFRINISDNMGLHPNGGYIFSTNNSGLWINRSLVNFTSTPYFVNFRVELNSSVGMVIGYRWYFNDTLGNLASTPIYTLTTQEKKADNPGSGGGGGGGGSETGTDSGEENPLFKPTYKQIQEGYELVVLKGYLILVNLSEKGQYLLEIAKIDQSTGVVQVLINSSSYFIDSDESVKIDLTGDNNYDLEMSVLSVGKSNSSRMRFKEIHEEMDPLDVPVNGNNSIDNRTVIEVFGGRTKIRLSKYAYIFSITLLIILILLVGYFVFRRIKKFGH